MLFITPAKGAKEAKDYFTRHMAVSDYYLRDATEVAGHWHGLGAELLGLSGTVDKESYFKLCDNINPKTDEQLTQRTKSERRVLYDFTFDAPKSVTLAYQLGGDERIMDAFRGAVKDTMSEMEGGVMARVRCNGRQEDRPSANLIWGEFIHQTTRPVDGIPDPHLHCHAVAFNATWDPQEERWKAAQFSNVVRDRGYYQASFHSRFAERLAELGYGIERDGNSFRLAGIDHATADKFSRRTAIIEAEAQRLGITDPDAKDALGRHTREKKNDVQQSMAELREEWNARLNDEERDAICGAQRGQKTTSLDASQAMDYALSHCFERGSAIPEKKLLQTALTQGVGAASVDEIKSEIARDNVIRRERLGQRWVTTQEVLREEIAMTDFARSGKGKHARLGDTKKLATLHPHLSKEQRQAALDILKSRDTVTALQGRAGTGKTTLLNAIKNAIEGSGSRFFAFAPSAEASRGVLRSEGFTNADTVERLLIDPKMQEAVKGGVLLIDEAGLLSVKDMKRLFDVAAEQGARIVLSGDSRQHAGVYRGDALRILEKDAGLKTAKLSEIRRQTNENYRDAVKAISEGNVIGKDGKTRLETGFEMLDNMKAIIEALDDERYGQIAADYLDIKSQWNGKRFKTALVISPTHAEGENVTQAIRERLKETGKLSGGDRLFLSLRSLNLTEAQRSDAREYIPGTVVQFHQNAKGFKRGERVIITDSKDGKVSIRRSGGGTDVLPLQEAKKFQLYGQEEIALAAGDTIRLTQNGFAKNARRGPLGKDAKKGVNNGATYQVTGFTRDGDIKLNNGYILPKNYGGIAHGYVVTSHSSQGKTSDVALIALGSESLAAANREQFYVSVSRGREAVKLYTDDKEAVRSAIQSSGARLSATEMMEGVKAISKPKPGLRDRLFKLHQTYRIYKEKLARLAIWDSINRQREGRGLER